MKKILISLVLIAIVSGSLVGGAVAYFSDTEVSPANTFSAGSLDLRVGEEDDPDVSTYFEVGNVVPGSSGSALINLENVGSIDGSAEITIINLVDLDNTLTEPEVVLADTLPEGELAESLMITISGNGVTIVELLSDLAVMGPLSLGTLGSGTITPITISYSINGEGVGNEIQTDSVSFDMVFSLYQ
jgi:predicted ribosomally synthesized peptide with SipW-like signal peptide